jgi:hypothetical protein
LHNFRASKVGKLDDVVIGDKQIAALQIPAYVRATVSSKGIRPKTEERSERGQMQNKENVFRAAALRFILLGRRTGSH